MLKKGLPAMSIKSLLLAMLLCASCALPYAASAAQPITLTFTGDVMLAGGHARQHGTPWLLSGVKPVIQADDLTIMNLECAVSKRGSAEKKQFTFRANPSVLSGLRQTGVEAVTLANNHAMDYGKQALLDTVSLTRQSGLTAVGAGGNAKTAYRPAILQIGAQRVALIGVSRVLPYPHWFAGDGKPGIASAYNPTRLLAEIRSARKQADLVVLYIHWGIERAPRPAPYQRALARTCIDAGADLIIGSHPHVLQGFEYYRGKLIAYSLGNFIFNDHTGSTMMVQTTFAGRNLKSAKVIPCAYTGYRPVLQTKPAGKASLFSSLQARSYNVYISSNGQLANRAH
jgi:poly-gamma-glutamate synthesis protein (capsule biosynthesis protein)